MVKLSKQTSGGYNHPRLIRNNKGDTVNSCTVYNSKWYNEQLADCSGDLMHTHGETAIPEEDIVGRNARENNYRRWRPDESNWMDFQISVHDELLPIYDDCVRDNDWYCRKRRGCHSSFAIGEGSIPAPAEGDFLHARRTHTYYQSVAEMREADKKAEEKRIQNG